MDAAVGLKSRDHQVVIYTSRFDRSHAFTETTDGTLDVRVRGDGIIPRNFGGRLSILCAMLRQLHLVVNLINTKEGQIYDVFIVDQLSICIPLIREYFPSAKILFYGHFPDKLLSDHTSIIKKIYRLPFDALEEWSTGLSDVIVVNSNFTKTVFREAFPRIKSHLDVLYPCVNTTDYLKYTPSPFPAKSFVLSINRFEKKKNIELAINAFSIATKDHATTPAKLILAGGYDFKVKENTLYLAELQTLCSRLGLSYATIWPTDGPSAYHTRDVHSKTVIFIPSIPDSVKKQLLADAAILAYTPSNEHFGIVPLEAMLAGTPVLATNSGGPLETVTQATGWHEPPDPEKWAPILQFALFGMTQEQRDTYAHNCRVLVLSKFSETEMALEFEKYCQIAFSSKRDDSYSFKTLEGILIVIGMIILFGLFILLKG